MFNVPSSGCHVCSLFLKVRSEGGKKNQHRNEKLSCQQGCLSINHPNRLWLRSVLTFRPERPTEMMNCSTIYCPGVAVVMHLPICSAVFPVFYFLCALLLWLKRTTTLVFVPYSCMDTSAKSWLPHQSQFGLVGQAEVCCGGPGVLTPSECVRPQVDFSVCSPFTSSSPVCGAPLETFCYICVINVQPPPGLTGITVVNSALVLILFITAALTYSGLKAAFLLSLYSSSSSSSSSSTLDLLHLLHPGIERQIIF